MKQRTNWIVAIIMLTSLPLISACNQGQFLRSIHTPTLSVTPMPTLTLKPTATFTPSMTPTITIAPTPTSTPFPFSDCNSDEPYIGKWEAKQDEMEFEAFACPDFSLVAIFHNQDFPEKIKINQLPQNQLEYMWGVSIDIDSRSDTGISEKAYRGSIGTDAELALARWSRGATKIVPFMEAFQKDVWVCEEKGCKSFNYSKVYAYTDPINRLIILRGKIFGINSKSRLLFSLYFLTEDNEKSYKTNWVFAE